MAWRTPPTMDLEAMYRRLGVPGYDLTMAGQLPAWYPQDVFERLTWAESQGRPESYNLGSKAAGAHQFIPATWKGLVEQGLASGDPYDPRDSGPANIALMTQNFERVKNENPGISDEAALEKSVQAYHGGWNPDAWGPTNRGYTDYVTRGPAGMIAQGDQAMSRSRQVAPGGLTEYNPDGEPMMASAENAMQGYDDRKSQTINPLASFLGGMAGSQAPAYSGGLQQIAAMFGAGSAQVSADMSDMRTNLRGGKFGNTPIPYRKPDGTMGMGRMAPGGTFQPLDIPGGGEFLKPTQFLNTGQGYMPVGYGETGPAAGQPQIPIEVAPGQTVEHQTQVKQATEDVVYQSYRRKAQPERYNSVVMANSKNAFVGNAIDEALGQVGEWSTGFGSYLKNLPTTEARSLEGKINTIKGNLALDTLIKMKAEGGTMGALSEKELQLLEGYLGDLDQAKTSDDFKGVLMKIKSTINERQGLFEDAYNRDWGDIRKYGDENKKEPEAFYPPMPDWFPDGEVEWKRFYDKEGRN